MPTLQEILEGDLGLGSEKTASAAPAQAVTDEIEKLAMEAGLLEEQPKTAATASEEKPVEQEKEAQMGLDSLYNEMFPEDAGLSAAPQEKVAEQEKVAHEEKLGSRAFDYFADRWDARVEKLAGELGADAKSSGGNPHGDSRPAQRQPDNKPANAAQAIDTAPQVTDVVKPQSGAEVVGDEKAQQMKAAAVRKHVLLSQLELE